jgi:hypothetical protein
VRAHLPPLHEPQLPQSELVLQAPQRPLLHLPQPLQSELVLQAPQRLLLHLPYLQSELVLQAPHWPPLHLLLGQSELVEHRFSTSACGGATGRTLAASICVASTSDWCASTNVVANAAENRATVKNVGFMRPPCGGGTDTCATRSGVTATRPGSFRDSAGGYRSSVE